MKASGFDLVYELFSVVLVLQEDMLDVKEAKEIFAKCLYTMNEIMKLYPTKSFQEMIERMSKTCDELLREAQAKLAEETSKFCVSEKEFMGREQ